ncbi:unnamed protein product [Spirodela intermedia]|uniref:Uncharacterized protein n=1 Tax=Spirodela intermedia TaxID=51605 RepID=A0A7I8IBA4_SPIIN|nr:unnamed protein product [Spirodela intermedia]CAA6654161.1 unnamed protein product [Spirodela intermedia]
MSIISTGFVFDVYRGGAEHCGNDAHGDDNSCEFLSYMPTLRCPLLASTQDIYVSQCRETINGD